MQQGDQTVLSLRPGGGRPRLLGPRFDLSSSSSSSSSSFAFGSFSSDLSTLRPHGGPSASFSVKVCAHDCLLSILFRNSRSLIWILAFECPDPVFRTHLGAFGVGFWIGYVDVKCYLLVFLPIVIGVYCFLICLGRVRLLSRLLNLLRFVGRY